ncbi:hypothetical protein B0H14DRAFT_2729862, partial [Mycena olivaceomarginata]
MSGRPLSLILPLLTELKRISINQNGDLAQTRAEFSRSWSKMDQPLQSALANVFSSPRLEAVHLPTALKEMSLSHLYFTQTEWHEPWPESQLWRPKLRFLLLNASSFDLCQYLVNPQIDLTHVRTLRLATRWPEQRKKMVLATSLRRSRGVEHLGLWVAYDFEARRPDLSPDLFATNLRSIHFVSASMVRLLVVFVKTCSHDSRLEYVTLDSFPDVWRDTPFPKLQTAINATVAHLPALKTIEMNATPTPWETDMHTAFSSLIRRGILRITKFQ